MRTHLGRGGARRQLLRRLLGGVASEQQEEREGAWPQLQAGGTPVTRVRPRSAPSGGRTRTAGGRMMMMTG